MILALWEHSKLLLQLMIFSTFTERRNLHVGNQCSLACTGLRQCERKRVEKYCIHWANNRTLTLLRLAQEPNLKWLLTRSRFFKANLSLMGFLHCATRKFSYSKLLLDFQWFSWTVAKYSKNSHSIKDTGSQKFNYLLFSLLTGFTLEVGSKFKTFTLFTVLFSNQTFCNEIFFDARN